MKYFRDLADIFKKFSSDWLKYSFEAEMSSKLSDTIEDSLFLYEKLSSRMSMFEDEEEEF